MKTIKKFFLILFAAVMLCGCSDREPQGAEGEVLLYQVSENGAELKKTPYRVQSESDDTVGIVRELLENYKMIDVRDFQIKERQLSLYFSSAYENFTGIDEVLLRAGIVKTLCQVDGVEYVEFFVDEEPLSVDGEPVGVMSRLSFLDSIGGTGDTQDKYVTLYFSDVSGTGMKEVTSKLTHDMTVPLARLLVEQLLKGPEELTDVNTSELRQTIPDGTTLNSLTIRDNVCYVDLSREFDNVQAEVKSEIVIYSIVNTLCELSDVNKVQFMIDGEQQKVYGDTKDFNVPFERNLDLVSGGSKG
ncbi:MAG: GerMN domain-containing protein [Roseburia sp.]|nr:GerMN domain-containing protein [Roseburia sp.]